MLLTTELNKYLFGFLPQNMKFSFLIEEDSNLVNFNYLTGNLVLNNIKLPFLFSINKKNIIFILENNNVKYEFSNLDGLSISKNLSNNTLLSISEHLKIVSSFIDLIDYGAIFVIDDISNKQLEDNLYQILESE